MSRSSFAFVRRAFVSAGMTAAMAFCSSFPAQVGAQVGAQLGAQLGDKAVRIVLPNATGSGVDTITRTAQAALAKALGKPVVIENQPGAGGIVGLQTSYPTTS